MRRRSRLRRIIWGGVALALLLGMGYAYVTRPGVLRARLVGLFGKLDLRVVRIGEISFSPSAGLEVRDLEVVAAESSPLASWARVPDPPPLLRVPRARVRVNLWAMLAGKFQPREVELNTPSIAVIWPQAEAFSRWSSRGADRITTPREISAELPRLKIDEADVAVFTVEDDQLRLQRRWVVDGCGALAGGDGTQPRAYVLRLDQVAGPVSARHPEGSSLAKLRWEAGRLISELGWTDFELARALLPPRWRQAVRPLHLSGQARAKRLVFERGGIRSAELDFEALRFCLPIESEMDETPGERFAQVTDAAGVLRYRAAEPSEADAASIRRGDLHLSLSGRLNGAATEFSMALFEAGRVPPESDDREYTGLGGPALLFPASEGYQISLRVEGLALPTAIQHPRVVSSKRLPRGVRRFLEQYNAEGLVNLRLEVWRGPHGSGAGLGGPALARSGQAPGSEVAGEPITHYRGELEAVGASCRYFRFPYRVEDVRGFVRFSEEGIVLDGLHGRHGAGRIRVDGTVASSKSWTGFELRFRGHNIATDHDLYAALPSEYQRLWRRTASLALCDVQTTLRRAEGSAQTGALHTDVGVTARLLAGSLKLPDGRRLENADGLIHISGGRVAIDDLYGYVDGGAVRLNGELALAEEDAPPRYDLQVELARAALRRTSEVRDGEGGCIGQLRFEGVGDVWGQVSSDDRGQSHYSVHITDGVLTGFDGSAPWTQVSGWLCMRGDEQRILSLTALRDDGRLEVSGTLAKQLGLDRPITLNVRAEDADLERLLRQLVPGRWSKIREALGIAGRGTLVARFHPLASTGGRHQQAADIELGAEHLRPKPLPLDLRDIEASLTLHAEGFDLRRATARYGDQGHLTVAGGGGWTEGNLWSDISVEAQGLEFTPDLGQGMPGPLASLLKRMAPRGRADLTLDRVLLTGWEQRAWNVVGELLLEGTELNVGAPLTDFKGKLSGSCEIRPDGRIGLAAEFTIDHGWLASRPIERWEGRLSCQPGSSRVQLRDVQGRLCDGALVGFAELDPDTSAYELSFTLHDVSLDQFLQREADRSGRLSPGRLDGHIFVRGVARDPGQRSGGGELRIRGTSLLSSPVTASVVKVSQQQKRLISDEVERAELRFVWEGEELKFSRVDIHSRDLRLIGMGRWNMRSDAISMTLLGATPEDAPRLAVLTDLIETAGQELMQYRVEGTAAEPRVTVEPLHNLTEPLRKLLRGE